MFTFWMLYFGSITNISTSFTSLLVPALTSQDKSDRFTN